MCNCSEYREYWIQNKSKSKAEWIEIMKIKEKYEKNALVFISEEKQTKKILAKRKWCQNDFLSDET